MNQNDSERYGWRTGQRWGRDSTRHYRGPGRKPSNLARAVVAACIFLVLLMGLRACGPNRTNRVGQHQEVKP